MVRSVNLFGAFAFICFGAILVLINQENNVWEPPPYPEDESLYIFDSIIEKTRRKITEELGNLNFSSSSDVTQLSSLVPESGGNPLRSVIFSSWRSGSTFLAEVITAVPGTFYHYEPLLDFDIVQIRGPPHSKLALRNLKKLMKCDYDDMESYFEFGKDNNYLFRHNTRLWEHCKFDKYLCLDPVFTGKFCSIFPFQSMKVVRMRLRFAEDLLKDSDLNVKILFLVRDPRAVLLSRQHRDFCFSSPDCSHPSLLCADMVSDYAAATRLTKMYPTRFRVLRYEDLALDPTRTSQELLQFFGLAYVPQVEEFLRSHTSVEVAGVSSTFRVSKTVPFRWKEMLNYENVTMIQSECTEAMKHWGYAAIESEAQLNDKSFSPLLGYKL